MGAERHGQLADARAGINRATTQCEELAGSKILDHHRASSRSVATPVDKAVDDLGMTRAGRLAGAVRKFS